MSILSKIFLSIPASTASSEQVFSKAGYLLGKRRVSLNSKTVDCLLFISNNSDKWK